MIRKIVLYTLLSLLHLPAILAQVDNYRFVNYGSKDGLLNKFIYSATQDKNGYMWFGTGVGLYRYDGHVFQYYRSPLDKAGNTISNVLQAIMTDADGNLWLGSFTSLQWYNPSKNIFWQPKGTVAELQKLNSSYFVNFSMGKYIWLSTNKNYVYRFNKTDSSFLSLANQYPAGASASSIQTVEVDNYLYDVHPEAMYIFTLDGKFVKAITQPTNDLSNLLHDKQDYAIYLTSFKSGLLKFDLATQVLSDMAPDNKFLKANNLFCVVKDDANNFYMGGYPLHILNPQKNYYHYFNTTVEKNDFTITASKVISIFKDREKNLWFCSHSGLSMLPWQNSQIKAIAVNDNTHQVVVEPLSVYAVPNSFDLLFTNTTSSGLPVVNMKTTTSTVITNTIEPAITKKAIQGIIIAPDSTIYASDGIHFFKYLPSTKTLQPFALKDQNDKPIINVSRNITDAKGRIYIGSRDNGFYIWDYYASSLLHYHKWEIDKTIADKDDAVQPCLVDSQQQVWFTSNTGVYCYNATTGIYTPYGNKSIKNIPVMDATKYIEQDKLGHYWIATINNGLYELYFENGKEQWNNYTINSGIGLPSDYCYIIKKDRVDSTLWIANLSGLLKFDPVQKSVLTVLTQQNGLAQEGGGYSFSILPNNTLVQLFYGVVNTIDLNTYQVNKYTPTVVFSSIKVMDKEQLFTVDTRNCELSLAHNENFLQFIFSALLYNNGNKNQYAYMLEGADKDWIYSGQKNTVTYSGLKPGAYYFKVKAANSDGLWGDITIVKIIIKQPFYLSWWFITLGILTIIGLSYWWNRFRITQTKKEEKVKAQFQQQIAETEMKALRAQMNPHFIFNSLNSIQKYILKNEHFAASQYLTKFSRLIRLILDHSNQSTILLSSELDLLKLYVEMESLRFDDKFTYTIAVAPGITMETAAIPSMLIQPYIENAIWHGLLHKEEKGTLTITFTKEVNNVLKVGIEDNGVGREQAAVLKSKQVLKKKSFGMQITEDRIAIINRTLQTNATAEIIDLKDANNQAVGTKVILHIPLQSLTN
jgi:ligand-binding sensor domain-containing protein/two-component sensor histidine kinase